MTPGTRLGCCAPLPSSCYKPRRYGPGRGPAGEGRGQAGMCQAGLVRRKNALSVSWARPTN